MADKLTDEQLNELAGWKALLTSEAPADQEDYIRLSYRYCWAAHRIDLAHIADEWLYVMLSGISRCIDEGINDLWAYCLIVDSWVHYWDRHQRRVRRAERRARRRRRRREHHDGAPDEEDDEEGGEYGAPVG